MTRDGETSRLAAVLRWCGIIGIATIAVMRCLIFFAPRLVFDVDPAFDPEPLGGLGPAGSLWLDALLFLACACGMLGLAIADRVSDTWLLVAAIMPVPVVLWHGLSDAGDLWRGVTWAAAALAGVVVMHLARDPRARRVLVILLLAVLVPLLARGAANITFEHQENIDIFESQKTEILQEKGWEDGSAFALIFERRLRHREPGGWFVTTNIFASFMAVGVIIALGLTIGSVRAGLPSGWSGLAGLVGLASAAALWMTGSKGALLATMGGLALLLVPLVSPVASRVVRRFGPLLFVLAIIAALGGVVVRGAMLPEGFLGEKSLLFRWHYMISSMHIAFENPIVGVGPDGFQPAYMLHRVARNPEEVASAHSVFLDWICGLGVLGFAWVTLVLVLIARAGGAWRDASAGGTGVSREDVQDRPEVGTGGLGGDAGAAVAVGTLGLLPAIVIEQHTLHDVDVAMRLIGLVGFVGAAIALRFLITRIDGRLLRWSLAAASIVLLVHGQIEMTLTQPGSAVWAMCLLGLAAAWRPEESSRGDSRPPGRVLDRLSGVVAAAFALLTAVIVGGWGAVPAWRQERLMFDAAEVLRPLSETEDGRPDASFESDRRQRAAETLLAAHAVMPTNLGPRIAAGEQYELAARREAGDAQLSLLALALEHGRYCVDRGDRGRAAVLVLFVERMLARVDAGGGHMRQAVTLARWLTESDPNGLQSWLRYADVRWEAGHRDEATAEAYRRARDLDKGFVLDPMKRLSKPEATRVAERLAELDA